MPLYESVIVTRQDINKTQVEKIISDFSNLIEDEGGKVKKNEYWGLKNLAYEINKNKKGHYTMLVLDSKPNSISEFERKLRINEDVIRFITIKIKNFEDKPSIMMQYVTDNHSEKV